VQTPEYFLSAFLASSNFVPCSSLSVDASAAKNSYCKPLGSGEAHGEKTATFQSVSNPFRMRLISDDFPLPQGPTRPNTVLGCPNPHALMRSATMVTNPPRFRRSFVSESIGSSDQR
jgi:hypothetical protein